MFPKELRYTEDHEWLGNDGKVGITSFAQESLGDVVFVELPAVGTVVNAGDAFGVVESVKSVSDLFSPVGGTVVEINPDLAERPELVNEDPFGKGWLIRLQTNESSDNLLDADQYENLVKGA
ncbi:MAG: glycine cleavage system protein GcvH [Firmicutes bacterium]|nr:glycine cleavage system protein GcvH [Bacillota bacterium]